MKYILVLTLSLFCFDTFAQRKPASVVDKLVSYLPVGFYEGKNDQDEFCSVQVSEVNYPKRDVQVRVMVPGHDLTKLVEENSQALTRDYKREFIQTDKSIFGSDDTQYIERILRTVIAGDKKQYVVVSYSVVANTERTNEEASCIVDVP
jgi:hypothetical protein